jgi:hypothetical protein
VTATGDKTLAARRDLLLQAYAAYNNQDACRRRESAPGLTVDVGSRALILSKRAAVPQTVICQVR